MTDLLHDLIFNSAQHTPQAEALLYQDQSMNYEALAGEIEAKASGLRNLGVKRGERVAVYLEKRFETVIAMFASSAAGGVFVPVNPVLKPEQVAHIIHDCAASILITSFSRLRTLRSELSVCTDLRVIIVLDAVEEWIAEHDCAVLPWESLTASCRPASPMIDNDMAAIIYTSGSTGKPKGVVLSHRNVVAGAKCVSHYLMNRGDDRILTVLPLSFDYGLNQLTSAFHAGAANILMNYLLPRDIIHAVQHYRVTGLAAVPPLWIQLAGLNWNGVTPLRYITNSGGAMPRKTLDQLRTALPGTQIFLMYGFTEAFRSTYLPPQELDQRPDSIGKAVPNAEILVLREDGSHCLPGETGELVHRGAFVAMGYWNDAEKTAQCFRPVRTHPEGISIPEMAAWSGDTVRMDEEGFLYFIERRDEMIKTSGYRVSPTEIEEVLYAMSGITEAVVLGVSHPVLGQAIIAVVCCVEQATLTADNLLRHCKRHLPAFMLPHHIDIRKGNLPRNPNGKIDRALLFQQRQHFFRDNQSESHPT